MILEPCKFLEFEQERDRTRNAFREIQEMAEAIIHFGDDCNPKELLLKIAKIAKGSKKYPYSFRE